MLPKTHKLFKEGTESDGSKNSDYCNRCFVLGLFTHPQITTAKQMQDFVREELKKQGIGKVRRWFYTLSIPQLKRWKRQ